MQERGGDHEGDGEGGNNSRQAGLQRDRQRRFEIQPGGQRGQEPADETGQIGSHLAPDKQDENDEDGQKGEEDGEEVHGWVYLVWYGSSLCDSGGDGKRVGGEET